MSGAALAGAQGDDRQEEPWRSMPFMDTKLPLEQRVGDLVSRLTLEEKISQMVHGAPGIPRLGIPAYNWWNECLHGVARAGTATVFPQAIGLAATWDVELMRRVADVISTEARAKHHEAARRGDRGIYKGLTFWSPNINIFRDPRWGRGQETYGEDPYLTGRLAVAFVKGLQGEDPRYLNVVATPKHFAVHSGPEPDRHRFDALTDWRDLHETYLPAIEAAVVEGGAMSVMCAYNRYLGAACCASEMLLQRILRSKWGFPGYVVSDCGAIYDIYKFHEIVGTGAEAAALAVRAGCDLNCGNSFRYLTEAVEKGLISEAEIDTAVRRLFTARFRLGMFDPPESVPYALIPIEVNDSPEHGKLALEAARESMVLLKNENNTLPLRKDIGSIAVIGPNADSVDVLLGNYNGTPSAPVTVLEGIRSRVAPGTEVHYSLGCSLVETMPVLEPVSASALRAGGEAGLLGEYFDNRELQGEAVTRRLDAGVEFQWTASEPPPGLEPRDFSVRWSGELAAAESGEYTLAVTGDDGYRLYVDGELVIDNWSDHGAETVTAEVELEAGKSRALRLEYYQAGGEAAVSLQWAKPGRDLTAEAVGLAQRCDVVVFVGGISPALEGEEMRVEHEGFAGGDRTDIGLPVVQTELLRALHATGKPVVMVLMSGSAIAATWEVENLPAILQAWYPGQAGGAAVADVLFGVYNPAGRLPVTFYRSVEDLPPFEDYGMANRTYRYFKDSPLFAFGHGLSYTRFVYGNLEMPAEVEAGEVLRVSVEVRNIGETAGDEVVQLYVSDVEASAPVPLRALQGFRRVRLEPGQSETVVFDLAPKQFSMIDDEGRRVVEPGEFAVFVGGGSAGAEGVSGRFRVAGGKHVVEVLK